MTIDSSVSDFLAPSGGKSASLGDIGDTIRGTVVSAETRQQTEFGTDKLLFWDDGGPMMQLVIALQTDQRDGEDDTGIRNLYVKGSKKPESMSLAAALIVALKKAGAQLEVGGTLAVKYVGEGKPSKPGFNPPKQYEMAYKAPALDTGGLLDDAPAAAPADPLDF